MLYRFGFDEVTCLKPQRSLRKMKKNDENIAYEFYQFYFIISLIYFKHCFKHFPFFFLITFFNMFQHVPTCLIKGFDRVIKIK